MTDILADTHVAIWYLFEPAKLSALALKALQDARDSAGRILVSTITPIEMTYLTERGRIPIAVLTGLWASVADPTMPFDVLPIATEVAHPLKVIPRDTVPDMPEHVIAAKALSHGLALASADQRIRVLDRSGLSVIW